MKRLFSLLFLLVALKVMAGDYSFRLKNELGFSRQGETVEVAVPEGFNLSNTTLSDEEGRTLPFELCGQHGIRFQAFVAHGATMGYVLSDGISLKQIVDLGIFLRKQGDRADYVKLQQWLQRLKMERMARLAGAMLTGLLGFADDEIPFVEGVTGAEGATKSDLSLIMKEIASLGQPHRSEWNFQQADSIFVHTTNTTAMFWQVRHSARYFRYCPSESLTSLLYTFAHSLSHVEE